VHRIAVVTAALAIAGCQTPNVGRLAEAQDLQRSPACRLSDGTGGMPISNQTAPITRMATANDRGWCWTTVWSGPGGIRRRHSRRVSPRARLYGAGLICCYDHDDYDTFPYQVTVNRSSSF
jgi:hypothetical protein